MELQKKCPLNYSFRGQDNLCADNEMRLDADIK